MGARPVLPQPPLPTHLASRYRRAVQCPAQTEVSLGSEKKKNHFLNGLFSPTSDPENVLRAQVPQLLHWNQPPPVAWPVCSPHRLPSSVHWVPSDLGRRLVCPLTFKTRDGDEIHNKLKPCPFSLRGLPVTHEEEHPHVPRRPLTAGETRTECVCVRVRALPLELTARAATQTGTHQLP